jgi:hypothetical protein
MREKQRLVLASDAQLLAEMPAAGVPAGHSCAPLLRGARTSLRLLPGGKLLLRLVPAEAVRLRDAAGEIGCLERPAG